MNRMFLYRIPALCIAAFALAILTGCQGRKIVARVNSATINEDELEKRAMRVTQIPTNVSTDAGGLTLINMINDTLINELAADPKYHAVPSEEEIDQFAHILEREKPDVINNINAGRLTEDEMRRELRASLEQLHIGTDGASPDEKEMQALFNQEKAQGVLKFPTTYTIRLLPVPSEAAGRQVLPQLQATGDFKRAAQMLGVPAAQAIGAGVDTVIVPDRFPELNAALDKLKDNAFTSAPVPIQLPDQTSPGGVRTLYVLAQRLKKQPESLPSYDEIKPKLAMEALERKFPQWQQHFQQMLYDFTRTSVIQINNERYKPLLDAYILPPPQVSMVPGAMPSATPPSGGAPLSGNQAQPPAPEPPAPEGASPPTGSTTTPNGNSAASSSGATQPSTAPRSTGKKP